MFKLASHIVLEGPLAARDAAGWVVRLCLALDAMHRLRISHGRISTRAIQMVSTSCDDVGFVLDGADLVDDLRFQSPERLSGGGLSPEDDTWAAGVLLYHAVTGALPFAGDTHEQLLARISKFQPRPLFRLGLTLPHLQAVIDAVLCPDPHHRTASVADLRARLVQCMPSTRDLPALTLGKPEIDSLADELDKRATLPREAARIVIVDEDTGRLPTQVMRPRGARPGRDSSNPAWDKAPASQGANEAPASSPRIDSQAASYWADDDSEIEVSYEVVEGVAMEDEGLDAPTSVLPSAQPRPSGPRPRDSGPTLPRVHAQPASKGPSGAASATSPAARRVATTLASPTTLDTEDTGLGAGPRSPWGRTLGAAAFVVLGGAAAYLLLGPRDATPTDDPRSAVALDASSDAAGGSTLAPSSAAASAAPSAVASEDRPPRPGGDLAGCVRALFPSDAFGADKRKLKLDFVCSQRDARKGARLINAQLVLGARPGVVTEGMREWAQLGWYELALFATAKTLCCEAPATLVTRTGADGCALDRALEQLGKAALAGHGAALDTAMTRFKDTATCLLREGGAGPYVALGVPGRAPAAAYQRFLARLRPASAR